MGLFKKRRKAVLLSGSSSKRKQRQRWVGRIRLSIALVAVVLMGAGAIRYGYRKAAFRAAYVETEQIRLAARRFRQDMERCPHDLGELAHPPEGGEGYLARPPRDPWGKTYHFNCPGRWYADDVDVASAGPDGRWGGGDDITTDL